MGHSQSPSAVAGLTALVSVSIFTIPSILKLIRSYSREKYATVNALYDDEDGTATEETQKDYSATVPKYIAVSTSVIGFVASIVAAAFITVHPTRDLYVENWLLLGCWVRMLAQREISWADSGVVITDRPNSLQLC